MERNYDNGHYTEKLEVETLPLNPTHLLGLQQETEDGTRLKCGHQYRHVSLLNQCQVYFRLNSTKGKKNISYKIENKYINKINNVEESMYSKRLLKYTKIYLL